MADDDLQQRDQRAAVCLSPARHKRLPTVTEDQNVTSFDVRSRMLAGDEVVAGRVVEAEAICPEHGET